MARADYDNVSRVLIMKVFQECISKAPQIVRVVLHLQIIPYRAETRVHRVRSQRADRASHAAG